jgi:putative DNA primase/helicase
MLLNGEGQNGKSILLNLIESFFSKANVSAETLHALLDKSTERFASASVFQKMVNVDADISPDVIFDNTEILKKLTGNDSHRAEEKYKKPFFFRNFAKLFFSCNKIPETQDLSDAFFRRMIIINFTQQFFGDKADFHLLERLAVESEFSGLLWELLTRVPRVVEEGVIVMTDDLMIDNYDAYLKAIDPVKYFAEQAIDRAKDEDFILKKDLYEHFEEFCVYHGLTPRSESSFSLRLKKEGYIVKRKRIEFEPQYVWMGIQKKEFRKDDSASQ